MQATLLRALRTLTIPFAINPINTQSRLGFMFKDRVSETITPPISKPTLFSLEFPAETKAVSVFFGAQLLTSWTPPFKPQDNYFLFNENRICTLPLDRLDQPLARATTTLRFVDQDALTQAQQEITSCLNRLSFSVMTLENTLKRDHLAEAPHRMGVFGRLKGLQEDVKHFRRDLFVQQGPIHDRLEFLVKEMSGKVRHLEEEKAQTYHGQECDVALFEAAKLCIEPMKAELEKIQEHMQYIV